jgi:Ca-activated chloride channel family protein
MIFDSSSIWFLLLLLAVPLLVWRLFVWRRAATVNFSATDVVADLGSTWKTRTWWIPPSLRIAVVVLVIVALARPQEGRKETIVDSEGIAIEMVVDRSGSMRAMDFELEGKPVDRLAAIKDVAGKFIAGEGELEGRPADLIGLVTFAGYADGISPLTLDHPYLLASLNQTEIAADRSEDGTAIGDALSLAVEKLNLRERRQLKEHDNDEQRKIKSKVVILLTDGENNAGDVEPLQAAQLAETLGVKVYTIGVGTKGRAPVPVVDPFTGQTVVQWAEVSIDEDTLKQIADATGGKYFRATDTASLTEIYEEIDQLEKSRVEERHYVDYRELAVEPIRAGMFTLPPLLLVALLLLVAECLLRGTVYRQIP